MAVDIEKTWIDVDKRGYHVTYVDDGQLRYSFIPETDIVTHEEETTEGESEEESS